MYAHGFRFYFTPLTGFFSTSREQVTGALHGRIPALLTDGELETSAECMLSAALSQVMLCGNPNMVKDTTVALAARGMKKHRRRDPGHITLENYW